MSIPSNGTVLVEGPNDAGKPSLIEAVRFGLTGLPSPDRSLESMIRHGESEAAVEVEFEGEFGSCTVERTVLGDGTVRSTLTLNGPDDASVLDDDGAIVDELAHLTGLDADDLSLPCFIESSNARETSKASGGGRESSLIVPKRTDLDRVRVDLSDVDDLEKSAADARDRVRLAKSADRLAGLEKIRGRAERLLKIARVRRAQLNFQAADSEFKSLNAALADWGAARSELNVRIDSAERKMATTNLVDGILKIRDERERLERRIQQTTDLIDEAGHKWSALVHERWLPAGSHRIGIYAIDDGGGQPQGAGQTALRPLPAAESKSRPRRRARGSAVGSRRRPRARRWPARCSRATGRGG